MISYIEEKAAVGKRQAVIVGLSTDTKPGSDLVANGSRFIEMDTGKFYMFDEAGDHWYEI